MKIFRQTVFLTVITILAYSCETRTANIERPKTPDELRRELKTQEQIEPTRYLTGKASLKENRIQTREEGLFNSAEYANDGYIFSGTIQNTASLAKFKDVVVKVTYLSETETPIETKEFIMYKYFEPNSQTNFEYKVNPPSAFKNFTFQITTATPVD